jgi:hypothetical protein
MTFHVRLDDATMNPRPARRASAGVSAAALLRPEAAHERAKLSSRLRRVLTQHPRARTFTVHNIIQALGDESVGPSVALFSATGIFELPDRAALSGAVVSGLGLGLALGRRTVSLPRALLKRKIPRNALALLIHGITGLLDAADGPVQRRWSWVFHPAMTVTLGLILFLLGLASMTPIVGGGVQHAASAFIIAVGLAERDGLAVVVGAVAGIAAIAVAVLSVASSSKLWRRVKAWLIYCANSLRLNVLTNLLDRCCDGLGELVRLKWGGLLLLILTPATPRSPRRHGDESNEGRLRMRARRALLSAVRSAPLAKLTAHAT